MVSYLLILLIIVVLLVLCSIDLIMSKPDIAYIVHVVSQFMHIHPSSNLNVVKHVFRNLEGTADHGLFFKANSRLNLLVAFCDADWVDVLIAAIPSLGFPCSLV